MALNPYGLKVQVGCAVRISAAPAGTKRAFDVERRLAHLATYLGHVDVRETTGSPRGVPGKKREIFSTPSAT
jgi:hypothetical protein